MRRLFIVSTLLLSACGGGGGGSDPGPGPGGGPGGGGPPPAPAPPPANQAPTITSLTFAAIEDLDFSGNLTASDPEGTAITYARTSDPASGTMVSFTSAGAFTYRPPANFAGSATFSVQATDAASGQTTATVTINVANADDDAPIIRADIIRTTGVNPLVDVLANDTETDGETLTLTLVGNPDFGSAAIENGKVRFTLPAGFKGFNRFRYSAVDAAGQGGTVNAVVFVDAQPVRLVYRSNAGTGVVNMFVDDLVSTRKITAIESATDGLSVGNFRTSADGRTLVLEKTAGPNEIREVYAIPADGSWAPRRITPDPEPFAVDAYVLVSSVSPDGRWIVFERRQAAGTRHYLADLSQNGVTTEIPLPAGAVWLASDYTNAFFGASSQYFYLGAEFPFSGGFSGTTIYRVAVANPAAPPQRVAPAAQSGISMSFVRASADESRILYTDQESNAESGRVRIANVANPSAAVTLSHVMAAGRRLSGFVLSNAALTKVYYELEIPNGPSPFFDYLFELYGADAAQANSGALIGALPADRWRPEIWELTSDETAIRFDSPRFVNGSFSADLCEIDVNAGVAQSRVLVPQIQGTGNARYIDGGNSLLYGSMESIYSVSRSGTGSPRLITTFANFGYEVSSDGTLVANAYIGGSPQSSRLYLANTSSSGVQSRQMTGIDDPTALVLGFAIVAAP